MPLNGYRSLCTQHQPIIVSKEQGRVHRANNPQGRSKVSHYRIDGYVIQGGTIRCDFLLMNDDSADAYLIELKGSDIEHGLEQLEATALYLQAELNGYRVKYRLIHSRAKTQAIDEGLRWQKVSLETDLTCGTMSIGGLWRFRTCGSGSSTGRSRTE